MECCLRHIVLCSLNKSAWCNDFMLEISTKPYCKSPGWYAYLNDEE